MTKDKLGKRLLMMGVVTEKELKQALERQQKHGGRLGHNLVELGLIKEEELSRLFSREPPQPNTIEESGLSISFIADLALKHIIAMGEFMLADLVEVIKLPVFIVEAAIEHLRRDKLVDRLRHGHLYLQGQ